MTIQDIKDITSFKWASVTQLSPLRIKLDGDMAALVLTPDSLVDPLSLSVDDRVRVELSLRKVVIHGVSAGPDALRRVPPRNLLRNARFRVNQRLAASATSLASGAYFLDGWKSGAATNAVTWTGSDDAGRVLTVPSGKFIEQVVEGRDVVPGLHYFGQLGSSGMRIIQGATDTGAVTSGTVTLVAGTDVRVLIFDGTVNSPILVRGGKNPVTFPDIGYSDDLRLCQRYYHRLSGASYYGHASTIDGTHADALVIHPVPMRTSTPTVTFASMNWTDNITYAPAVTAIAVVFGSNPDIYSFRVTYSAGAAARTPGWVYGSIAGSYLAFDCEL